MCARLFLVHSETNNLALQPQNMPFKRIKIIDSHTGGEPTRVVISGGPDLGAGSVAEQLECFKRDHDSFRSAVVNERPASTIGRPPGSFAGCALVIAGEFTTNRSKVRRKLELPRVPFTLTTLVVPSRMSTVMGLLSILIHPSASRSAGPIITGAESGNPSPFV